MSKRGMSTGFQSVLKNFECAQHNQRSGIIMVPASHYVRSHAPSWHNGPASVSQALEEVSDYLGFNIRRHCSKLSRVQVHHQIKTGQMSWWNGSLWVKLFFTCGWASEINILFGRPLPPDRKRVRQTVSPQHNHLWGLFTKWRIFPLTYAATTSKGMPATAKV